MLNSSELATAVNNGRLIEQATPGDKALGVLQQLPGIWKNVQGLEHHGWNIIALPFGKPGALGDFRLLLNQFDETLTFSLIDKNVPNRGADHQDQHLAALQYVQDIKQFAAIDAASDPTGTVIVPATPDTNDTPKGRLLFDAAGKPTPRPVAIHHEPGTFLHLANLIDLGSTVQPGPDLARLASIPHGDSLLALGNSLAVPPIAGPPNFNDPALRQRFDALPVGLGSSDVTGNIYFGPYKHFRDNKFQGLLDPTDPISLLAATIPATFPKAKVIKTTTISFDTEFDPKSVTGGIRNIPFVSNQANAKSMIAVFWVQQLDMNDGTGETKFVVQYIQKIMLEFLRRTDDQPGLIQWPHITFNTMIRS